MNLLKIPHCQPSFSSQLFGTVRGTPLARVWNFPSRKRVSSSQPDASKAFSGVTEDVRRQIESSRRKWPFNKALSVLGAMESRSMSEALIQSPGPACAHIQYRNCCIDSSSEGLGSQSAEQDNFTPLLCWEKSVRPLGKGFGDNQLPETRLMGSSFWPVNTGA